ncbi:cyclin-dependent protein kinase inhibitor SMR4 [Manihot esculenta]|uniref:Uncharacterized protein n=1 Tax=Manihot esculenta TaxID=3983 RepID=A0A2C9V993_MANES|nr:cyclin-dependent protein kinase inhibitor SMR4 [Manihot esculenta]OAY41327.1 hypothetical protein MANES_09G092400v8 [Manihot esculenta]
MEIDERFEIRDGVEECTTPKSDEYRIPAPAVCPPPPRKKSVVGKMREPPKKGYFQSPDLDLLLSMPPRRRQAWV